MKNVLKVQSVFDRFLIRFLLVAMVSLYISEIGSTLSLAERILSLDFYKEYLATFIIALSVFELVYRLNCWVDRKFSWHARPVLRLLSQLLLGILLPALVVFLMATFYFALFDVNILKTDYLYYIFPLVLVLLFFLNIVLIMVPYFMAGLRAVKPEQLLDASRALTAVPTKSAPDPPVKVYRGQQIAFLELNNITGAYIVAGQVLVRTKSEELPTDLNLDELEHLLDKQEYFRINRQLIAQRSTCMGYEVLEYGKIEVQLHPDPPVKPVVSQIKAKAFKQWIAVS